MHFGDPAHIKAAQLQIVVYKHDTGKFEILQIYSCKYMDLIDLLTLNSRLFENHPYFSEQLNVLKPETFYLVDMKCDNSDRLFTWIKHTEITGDMIATDPLLTLH